MKKGNKIPLERITSFTPAFDKRHKNPKKDYGIHGVELRMVLKGELGAVHFVLYTNWQLPHVTKELLLRKDLASFCLLKPLPADLGYHSPKPMYKGHKALTQKCEYLNGKKCYYDGSGLNAERIYNVLLTKGSEGVWIELEKYYNHIFSKKESTSVKKKVSNTKKRTTKTAKTNKKIK